MSNSNTPLKAPPPTAQIYKFHRIHILKRFAFFYLLFSYDNNGQKTPTRVDFVERLNGQNLIGKTGLIHFVGTKCFFDVVVFGVEF